MVVLLDIYAFLSVMPSILFVIYLVFLFIGREKIYSKVIRYICAFSFVAISTLKTLMEIFMHKSYASSILLIILGSITLIILSIQLIND